MLGHGQTGDITGGITGIADKAPNVLTMARAENLHVKVDAKSLKRLRGASQQAGQADL